MAMGTCSCSMSFQQTFSKSQVVDHYAGDLQLLDDLLDLKRRYGDRVHFVLGNRGSASWPTGLLASPQRSFFASEFKAMV